jgi:hypothetical protein
MVYARVRYGSHLENFSSRLAHESHRGKPNYEDLPSHAAARRDNVNTFIAARPTASSIHGARSLSNRSSHFEISDSKCSQRGLGGDIGGLRQTAVRTAAGGGRASRLKHADFTPFPRAMEGSARTNGCSGDARAVERAADPLYCPGIDPEPFGNHAHTGSSTPGSPMCSHPLSRSTRLPRVATNHAVRL